MLNNLIIVSMINSFFSLLQKKNNNPFNTKEVLSSKKMLDLLDSGIKTYCGKNKIYLEVGVYKGGTIIKLSEINKKIKCIGVDNFSLFDKNKKNYLLIKKKIKQKKLKNISIINKDFEEAAILLKKKNIKVGVIFIDAAHDYRSQLIALFKYYDLLSKNSLIIVDDCNYYHVRKANSDFLNTQKNCNLIFQKYTKVHVANLTAKKKLLAFNDYWNGVNVILKGKCSSKYKKEIFFDINEKKARNIFPLSHEVFRNYYAYSADKILNLVYDLKFSKISKDSFFKKLNKIKTPNYLNSKSFKSCNFN